MSGLRTVERERKKKWPSVLGYRAVRGSLTLFQMLMDFPENFEVKDLRWSPDGKGLVLLDKDTFCCAFEVEES
jgi:hypothetical protein